MLRFRNYTFLMIKRLISRLESWKSFYVLMYAPVNLHTRTVIKAHEVLRFLFAFQKGYYLGQRRGRVSMNPKRFKAKKKINENCQVRYTLCTPIKSF